MCALHMETNMWCLQKVLERCRLYHFSLNPLKHQFGVKHGIILGHVVSKNGIAIDEGKVKIIEKLPPPTNAKDVQCFMGHADFYKRSIFNYVEIVRPLYHLLIQFV